MHTKRNIGISHSIINYYQFFILETTAELGDEDEFDKEELQSKLER